MRKFILSATGIRLSMLFALLVTVFLFQNIDGWGDFYAQNLYPSISFILSSFSNIFPFAIGDLFIFLIILFLIIFPFVARKRAVKWKKILFIEVETLVWVYVWFYMAWGLNYYQSSLLEKLNIKQAQCTEEIFVEFASDYILKLNSSYQDMVTDTAEVNKYENYEQREVLMQEIVKGYHLISNQFAILSPSLKKPRVKAMMFSPLSSMVGVSGSMGPFLCEFTVNSDVLPFNYPATYAHEMAHQLGITSEAEANFYAYQVCTRANNKQIKFSGYNSILLYVLGNARSILGKDEYKELYESITPEIIVLAQERSEYWDELYFKPLGELQSFVYDFYLKSNRISSGTKNYSEVIGLLISVQNLKSQ